MRHHLSEYNRENAEKVPESLVRFLEFVTADMEQSEQDFEDEFVDQLQRSVHNVKESREMRERYMIFEEMMEEERKAGIEELVDGKKLKALHKLAAKSESIESFEKDAQAILASTEKV